LGICRVSDSNFVTLAFKPSNVHNFLIETVYALSANGKAI